MRTLCGFFLVLTALVCLSTAEEPLEDICECECCYELGKAGRIECVRKAATSFQIGTCTNCNVSICKSKFPQTCKRTGVIVNVTCVERTAWYLRLIPVFFLLATVSLLFYGFFIKTFDGYNPIPSRDDLEEAYSRVAFSAAPYSAMGTSPFQPRQPHAVRRPSPLASTVPLASSRYISDISGTSVRLISSPNISPQILPMTSSEQLSRQMPLKISEVHSSKQTHASPNIVRAQSNLRDYSYANVVRGARITERKSGELAQLRMTQSEDLPRVSADERVSAATGPNNTASEQAGISPSSSPPTKHPADPASSKRESEDTSLGDDTSSAEISKRESGTVLATVTEDRAESEETVSVKFKNETSNSFSDSIAIEVSETNAPAVIVTSPSDSVVEQ